MKGVRSSGLQKLIKDECPSVLDIGCICHLTDLTIKAGMQSLPVNIDHLFIDVFYYFNQSSKRKQEFCDLWYSLFTSEPNTLAQSSSLCQLLYCSILWV